ncbi:MAG: family 43 glycosylhydrolase [Barnesiella sp.]|nr:family 43 glycosylhydrolase [Barnesiella sp.]MBD5247328.1 family 43 glycosylhydrolase [Barnesiella sp.]
MRNYIYILILHLIVLLLAVSCGDGSDTPRADEPVEVFANGSYPFAVKDGDTYYYTMPDLRRGHISIYSATSPENLGKASPVTVWETDDNELQNIWSPELHKIDGKWYIYFEADNGNTDNHHIYLLENESENPLTRHWTLRGPVIVNEEWNYGIHPSVFTVNGRLYMTWSGWERRRTEAETQCIFIAEMENPWTLKSERVLISRPEYEWERQWINPDGSCSAYPIFVNENPQPYLSPDGSKVIINYSASGIWTVYSALGMLSAPATADLLDPASWTKSSEPVFLAGPDSQYGGASNISLIPSPDGRETLMLYQAKQYSGSANTGNTVMLKKITWQNSIPNFGNY